MSDKGVRAYCFTLNNWTLEEREAIKETPCKYLIFGEEIAPTTGTPHLQGYVYFKDAKTMKAAHKLPGWSRVAMIIANGSADSNEKYCSEDGIVFEKGTKPKQGKRNDLEEIADAITQGESLTTIAQENPAMFIKFHKGFTALKHKLMKDRTLKPTVVWYWGSSGTGKTRSCVEAHPEHYIKDGSKWWDGYEQQEAIIIDDFNPRTWDFRDFLRLLDRYKFQGETKGSYVPINSPYILITCEFPPEHYWKDNTLKQVTRRIDEVICLNSTEVGSTEVAEVI